MNIFEVLRNASRAYYETAVPLMSDQAYDALLEQARALDPENSFFQDVGAIPAKGRVSLPMAMPSLKKIKPDTIGSWQKKGPFVVTDKLDGISALWVFGYNHKALYLRGNGLVGQDCSIPILLQNIQGLVQASVPKGIVRGELIVPRSLAKELGTAARNWVNGVLHQITPSLEDVKKIQFVAYQVMSPASLTRSQQMTWLENQGFLCAFSTVLETLDSLQDLHKQRKTDSLYECDGLVVGMDQVPEVCKNAQDPKDAVAFKMVSEDQRAMTTILDVEWNSSRTKTWIPRILFTPVQVGTVMISCCTGVHAQNVVEKGLGIGAQVIIRRSGDVIPIIDSVVVPATALKMPPEGRWAWDERNVHALDTSTEMSSESKALHIVHTLTHMGIEGIRASTAMKLVEMGIDGIANIGKTSSAKLQEIVGPKTGSKLSVELKECLKKAQEKNWILAYPSWPKGFGDVRMDAALLLEPSVTKWPSLTKSPQKMSMDSFKEIQNCVPAFLAWRQELMTVFDISTTSAIPVVANTTLVEAIVKNGKMYVMSGFRDKEISLLLDAAGWEQQDRITKTTTVLLVPDDAKETEKVRAARTAGVRIVVRSQIKSIL